VVGVNLKEGAAANGVGYSTARQWFREGRLPVPARRVGGLILVDQPASPPVPDLAVVCARGSSADRRSDLDRQVARVTAWAGEHNIPVGRVVTEVGSALDGQRRKFLALLRDPAVTTIVVEHRGRFARFGAEQVEAALSAQGRRLLVVDPAEGDGDLAGDISEILTSLCARLYGRRDGADRAARAIAAATGNTP